MPVINIAKNLKVGSTQVLRVMQRLEQVWPPLEVLCIPDVMGSDRWEGQVGSSTLCNGGGTGPKLLTFDATTNSYFQTCDNIAGNIWPDAMLPPQSIEVTFANIGNVVQATPEDLAIVDYCALELWRHDNLQYGDGLRVVIQIWDDSFRFDGTTDQPLPAGWYWWVEWYDDVVTHGYIYEFYPDAEIGGRPGLGGDEFVARFEVDVTGEFVFSVDGVEYHRATVDPTLLPTTSGKIGFWLDRSCGGFTCVPPPDDAPSAAAVCMLGESSLVFCDDFERPDGPLGDDWIPLDPRTLTNEIAPVSIESGAVITGDDNLGGGSHHFLGYTRVAREFGVGVSQFIEFTISGLWQWPTEPTGNPLVAGHYLEMYTQVNLTDVACQSMYVQWDPTFGSYAIYLEHYTAAGEEVSIGDSFSGPMTAANDAMTLRFESDPDGTMRAFVDGALVLTVVDPDVVLGDYVGFALRWYDNYLNTGVHGVSPRIDDFCGGPLVELPPPAPPVP